MKRILSVPLLSLLVLVLRGAEPNQILGTDFLSGELLGRAMGALYAPRCAEDPLVKRFPHRKTEIEKSLTAFNTKYATAWRNIMNDPGMKTGVDRGLFQPLFDGIKQMQEAEAAEMTEADLDAYLSMIREMTDHFMKGVDLDTRQAIILSLYHENPLREIRDNCVETYYSRDNRKALGIDFSIQHPISWSASGGESGHVIQKFTSNAGLGNIAVTIAITDLLPLLSFEGKELFLSGDQEVERGFFDGFKEEGLKNIAFGEETVLPSTIETQDIVLERHSGIRVDAKYTGQRQDLKTESWTRCYMILCKGKLLMITGSYSRVADGAKRTDKTVQKEISDKTVLAKQFVDLMAKTFTLNPRMSR